MTAALFFSPRDVQDVPCPPQERYGNICQCFSYLASHASCRQATCARGTQAIVVRPEDKATEPFGIIPANRSPLFHSALLIFPCCYHVHAGARSSIPMIIKVRHSPIFIYYLSQKKIISSLGSDLFLPN